MIRFFVLLLFVCVSFAVNGQDEARAEEFYAVGVSEFRAGRLEQSLAAFRMCDSLRVKEEGYYGVTENAGQWIAYLLFQMGHEEEARQIDEFLYQLPPIDYREITESRELEKKTYSYAIQGNFDMAYWFATKCMEKEKELLGENHYTVAGSYLNMADFAGVINSKKNQVIGLLEQSLRIFEGYGERAKPDIQLVRLRLAYTALRNSQTEYAESVLRDMGDVIPFFKCQWYGARACLCADKKDVEGLVAVTRDFVRSEESKLDTFNYNDVCMTFVGALMEMKREDVAIDVATALCQFVEEKYGKSSYEYYQAIMTKLNMYQAAGRIFDGLYFAGNTLFNSRFNFLDGDNDVFYRIISCGEDEALKYYILPSVLSVMTDFSYMANFMGSQIDLSEGFRNLLSEMEKRDWQRYVNRPGYDVLCNIYLVSQEYIAQSYFRHRDTDKGLAVLEEVLKVNYKNNADKYFSIKAACAQVYYHKKNYKKALAYLEDCLKHMEHLDNQNGFNEQLLAACYVKTNPKSPRIAELIETSYGKHRDLVVKYALNTSYLNKMYNWNKYKPNNDGFAALANISGGRNMVLNATAYNSILLGKSFFLSTQADVQRAVYASDDPNTIAMYENVQRLRKQAQYDSTRAFVATYIQTESELMTRLASDNDFVSKYVVTTEDVRSHLNDKSVAVEFLFSQDEPTDSSWSYYAYVLRSDWEYPQHIKLDITDRDLHRAGIYQDKKLSERIWGEIIAKAHIKEGDTIYFAADKDLLNVSIENMQWGKAGEPLSAVYNMFRLTSTRELAIPKEKREVTSVVLYGGLEYRSGRVAVAHNSGSGQRAADQGLIPLKGSKQEIDEIARVFHDAMPDCRVVCYSGTMGTEQSFNALSGNSPSILHIATHGDYKEGGNNAMDNSVLYLAGSEDAFYGESSAPHSEDGILTATEIVELDLSNVDLAVLSACNTALGGIGMDGVEGLQRGFKNAGVRSLMMSLWPVDDRATRTLLTEFYRNWIVKGMSKHDALEAAKKTVRETPGWSDPEFWAAFILLD